MKPRNNIVQFPTISMTSLEVAELTGKRHDHVMRDVDNMINSLDIKKPKFGFLERINGLGHTIKDKHYILNKRECLILVSGYSVHLRAKIIDRMEELEAALMSSHQTRSYVAKDRNKLLEDTIIQNCADIADLQDEVFAKVSSQETFTVSELGDMMNPGRSAVYLNRKLIHLNLQTRFKNGREWSYRLTDGGKEYGVVERIVNLKNGSAEHHHIRWRKSVLKVLK